MLTTPLQPKDSELTQRLIDHLIARGPAGGKETVTPAVIARWERQIKRLRADKRRSLKREAQG